MTDAPVVPFGKYRDRPVDAILADANYRNWLLAQDWFRRDHQSLFQIIFSGGKEPECTPEHNAMQAQFLDDDWLCGVGKTVKDELMRDYPDYFDGFKEVHGFVDKTDFEVNGWDLYVKIGLEIDGSVVDTFDVFVELKPILSDDYPAVMREMKRRKLLPICRGVRRILIARQASFESVTLDQVKEIFLRSGILLVLEEDIAP